MRRVSVAIAFAAAFAGCQAGASTLTYYYVGAVADVSRLSEWDPSTGYVPLSYNVGALTIDRSKLEGGTLANARLTYKAWAYDSPEPQVQPEAVTGLRFSAHDALADDTLLTAFDLTFDENENLVSWKFDSFAHSFSHYGGNFFNISSNPIQSDYPHYPVPLYERYQFWADGGADDGISSGHLSSLGYAPDHPDYEPLACGSWTGIDGICPRNEEGYTATTPAWSAYLLATKPGQWFRDDPLAFARQLALNNQLAALDPPNSYDDIPRATPVPLPGGLPLLAGGLLAGAAFLRRRRAAA